MALCFTWTTLAWSAPRQPRGAGQPSGRSPLDQPAPELVPLRSAFSKPGKPEVPVSRLASQIEIPENLGSIEKRFIPNSGSESYQDPPLIVHLQDAHSSYEAQVNTRKILSRLVKDYGFDLILLEGGIDRVSPGRLKFFEDPGLNFKMADRLAREAVVSGAELFFLEDGLKKKTKSLEGFGLENLELYSRNLKAFQKVYQEKTRTDRFLAELKSNLLTEGSRIFNPRLKRFFREWVFQNETSSDLMRHLGVLQKTARDELKLDLSNVAEQFDWPQLVRIFKLKEMEKEIDSVKSRGERERLLTWVRQKGMGRVWLECLRRPSGTCASRVKLGGDEGSVRGFFERFYDEAGPLGFRFKDYPHWSAEMGARILQSELKAPELFGEIERLTEKLLDHLAKEEKEKVLVRRYKDYLLLRKLFSLQLTAEEYGKILKRNPSPRATGSGRLDRAAIRRLSKPPFPLPSGERVGVRGKWSVDRIFNHALRFYSLALRREDILFRNAILRMKASKKSRAVLITGGFHSRGLFERLKGEGFAYLEIMPHISEAVDDRAYLNLMTAQNRFAPHSSARQPLISAIPDAVMQREFPEIREVYALAIRQSAQKLNAGRRTTVAGWTRRGRGKGTTPELRGLHNLPSEAQTKSSSSSPPFNVPEGSTSQPAPAIISNSIPIINLAFNDVSQMTSLTMAAPAAPLGGQANRPRRSEARAGESPTQKIVPEGRRRLRTKLFNVFHPAFEDGRRQRAWLHISLIAAVSWVLGPPSGGLFWLTVLFHETGHYVAARMIQSYSRWKGKPALERVRFHPLQFAVSPEYVHGNPLFLSPQQELLITLAGPLTNLGVALAALIFMPPLTGEAARLVSFFWKINLLDFLFTGLFGDGLRALGIWQGIEMSDWLKEFHPKIGRVSGMVRSGPEDYLVHTDRGIYWIQRKRGLIEFPITDEFDYRLPNSQRHSGFETLRLRGNRVVGEEEGLSPTFNDGRYALYEIQDFPQKLLGKEREKDVNHQRAGQTPSFPGRSEVRTEERNDVTFEELVRYLDAIYGDPGKNRAIVELQHRPGPAGNLKKVSENFGQDPNASGLNEAGRKRLQEVLGEYVKGNPEADRSVAEINQEFGSRFNRQAFIAALAYFAGSAETIAQEIRMKRSGPVPSLVLSPQVIDQATAGIIHFLEEEQADLEKKIREDILPSLVERFSYSEEEAHAIPLKVANKIARDFLWHQQQLRHFLRHKRMNEGISERFHKPFPSELYALAKTHVYGTLHKYFDEIFREWREQPEWERAPEETVYKELKEAIRSGEMATRMTQNLSPDFKQQFEGSFRTVYEELGYVNDFILDLELQEVEGRLPGKEFEERANSYALYFLYLMSAAEFSEQYSQFYLRTVLKNPDQGPLTSQEDLIHDLAMERIEDFHFPAPLILEPDLAASTPGQAQLKLRISSYFSLANLFVTGGLDRDLSQTLYPGSDPKTTSTRLQSAMNISETIFFNFIDDHRRIRRIVTRGNWTADAIARYIGLYDFVRPHVYRKLGRFVQQFIEEKGYELRNLLKEVAQSIDSGELKKLILESLPPDERIQMEKIKVPVEDAIADAVQIVLLKERALIAQIPSGEVLTSDEEHRSALSYLSALQAAEQFSDLYAEFRRRVLDIKNDQDLTRLDEITRNYDRALEAYEIEVMQSRAELRQGGTKARDEGISGEKGVVWWIKQGSFAAILVGAIATLVGFIAFWSNPTLWNTGVFTIASIITIVSFGVFKITQFEELMAKVSKAHDEFYQVQEDWVAFNKNHFTWDSSSSWPQRMVRTREGIEQILLESFHKDQKYDDALLRYTNLFIKLFTKHKVSPDLVEHFLGDILAQLTARIGFYDQARSGDGSKGRTGLLNGIGILEKSLGDRLSPEEFSSLKEHFGSIQEKLKAGEEMVQALLVRKFEGKGDGQSEGIRRSEARTAKKANGERLKGGGVEEETSDTVRRRSGAGDQLSGSARDGRPLFGLKQRSVPRLDTGGPILDSSGSAPRRSQPKRQLEHRPGSGSRAPDGPGGTWKTLWTTPGFSQILASLSFFSSLLQELLNVNLPILPQVSLSVVQRLIERMHKEGELVNLALRRYAVFVSETVRRIVSDYGLPFAPPIELYLDNETRYLPPDTGVLVSPSYVRREQRDETGLPRFHQGKTLTDGLTSVNGPRSEARETREELYRSWVREDYLRKIFTGVEIAESDAG
ncbi:MAG: hypothetical protein HYU34_03230, partial [Candidatus Omnitrophica bacterium]|nr:hypothetical protein [Candidatus Omnitrophota bacterium]